MVRMQILFLVVVIFSFIGCHENSKVPEVVRRLESKWSKESYSFDFRSFRQHTDEAGLVFQQIGVVGEMQTNGDHALQAITSCTSEAETNQVFKQLESTGAEWNGDLLNLSNPNYAAQIAPKDGGRFVLNSVSESNGAYGFALQNLSMFDMSDPLWILLQDKYELVDCSEETFEGAACQKVEFMADMSGIPVKCSHLFNAELQCLRQEIAYTEGDYNGTKIITLFDYPNEKSLVPASVVVTGSGKSAKQAMKYTTGVTNLVEGEAFDTAGFFLTKYGLPEPDFDSKRRLPSWVWIVVAGLVCCFIGLVLKRRQK